MNTSAQIEVMQAFVNGKPIQFKGINGWANTSNPTWNWAKVEYRIEPKLFEMYALIDSTGDIDDVANIANKGRLEIDCTDGYRVVKMREVIE